MNGKRPTYHYTTAARAAKILSDGLMPDPPAGAEAHFTQNRKTGKGIWAFPGPGWEGNVDSELAAATKTYWRDEIANIHGVDPSGLVLLTWEATTADDIVDDPDGPQDIACSLIFRTPIDANRISKKEE